MRYKEIFHKMRGGEQLFFLGFMFFFGFILFYFIIASVIIPTFGGGNVNTTSLSVQRITQVVYVCCTYLLPSILFAFLFEKSPKLFFIKYKNKISLISLVLILIICIQPFIYLLSYYNEQISLPETMSGVEEWMKNSEMAAKKVLSLFLEDKSVSSIILNILIIAILAGVSEELFFRGTLQQILNKIISNKHLAIWVTAIIFSAIHLQFYGFFSRLILGALLGYLFIWSGNIFLPMLAHIIHNLINLIALEVYYGTSAFDSVTNPNMENYMGLAAISFILSIITIFFLHKKRINN